MGLSSIEIETIRKKKEIDHENLDVVRNNGLEEE